jgi:hypothetical protein
MRFQLVARRAILAPLLSLALVAAVAACSSSSSSSSSSSPATSAPASSVSAPASSATSPSSSDAAAAITANWEKFFNSSTPNSERVALLQNGSTFAGAITALSKLPVASGISAKVTGVTVNDSTSATVTYNIVSGGTSLLSGQTGKAVYQDGTWKVGDASLCALLKLVPGGSVPAACNSVS